MPSVFATRARVELQKNVLSKINCVLFVRWLFFFSVSHAILV